MNDLHAVLVDARGRRHVLRPGNLIGRAVTAACRLLTDETVTLEQQVNRFQTRDSVPAITRQRAAAVRTVAPARPRAAVVRTSRNLAVKDDDWNEF